ncbi:hypothetical protein [Flavobacterium sp. H4147]|uniref:hypothetical protein n=1 Tax=Flavobacterium sp. H4147 TaxID=3034149 RepID=UPI0023EAB357|nr:hypothetical protein [Flavobacterium sp. H4147]
MKIKISRILVCYFVIVSTISTAQIKTKLEFRNYIKTDITVNIESYDKKGKLKVNQSFIIPKATVNKTENVENIISTNEVVIIKGYKEGNIKIKYNPTESNTKFTLDPIQIPSTSNDLNHTIPLTGLVLYDVNDNKQRLISVGTDLKFNASTTFTRLTDVKQQLGSLIIGKKENEKLIVIDVIPLKNIDITYDRTSVLQESTVTEKSIISQLKVSVPIYGSIESMMSSSDLNQIKWDISYYPFLNNTSFSQLVTDLDLLNKKALVSKLKLNDSSLNIFMLRGFDVIESGIFSVTNGTKINNEGNAAIASIFTANAAYAFKSEDSKFISIPNKAYNLSYEKWQTVGELIQNIENKILNLPNDRQNTPSVLTPYSAM